MKQTIQILLSVETNEQVESVQTMIRGIDPNADFKIISDWEAFLSLLPKEEKPGFNEAAKEWVRSWGNGGGDSSTDTCIRDIEDTDIPLKWAEDAYSAIVNYSMTPFEAADLIMTIVHEVLMEQYELSIGIADVEYVSEWGDGTVAVSRAKWNMGTGEVFDIEAVEVDPDGGLEREYIRFADGRTKAVEEREGAYYALDTLEEQLQIIGDLDDMLDAIEDVFKVYEQYLPAKGKWLKALVEKHGAEVVTEAVKKIIQRDIGHSELGQDEDGQVR